MGQKRLSPNNYVSLLPFMASSLQLCFVLASYLLGILYSGNINYLPFPGDLGKKFHERGFFGIAMIIGSIMSFSVVLFRYIQINSIPPRTLIKLNNISMIFGVLMSFSQALMVIYPKVDGVELIYSICSKAYYITACFYMLTQAYISRRLYMVHKRLVIIIRIVLSSVASAGVWTYVISRLITPESEQWYKIPHISEWITYACIIVYISTYCSDFNNVNFLASVIERASFKTGNIRTNYTDYLRNQNRSRKASDSQFKYHVSTKC